MGKLNTPLKFSCWFVKKPLPWLFMKKVRVIKRKINLNEKSLNLAHPVVKASYIWSIVSEQLSDVLGTHVHHQFFKEVKPLVISHNVLILEVSNHFRAQLIHTHYHELVDVLLSVLDKKLSSFFISQSERLSSPQKDYKLLEGTTAKVKRKSEDEKGQG
jgi:DnaA N-terminal domain